MTELNAPAASAAPDTQVQTASSAVPSATVEVSASPTTVATPSPAAEVAAPAATVEAPVAKVEAPTVAESAPVADEPAKAPSLLGEEPAKPDLKVVEAVKEPVAEKPAEAAPAAPVFEDFKLPEGFVHDKTKISEFTKDLADLELATKADHKFVQEFGQKLMDKYTAEVKNIISETGKAQKAAFEAKRTEWYQATLKDPVLGGDNLPKTINATNEFIKTHGGTPEQQKEFRELMASTGIDNHPAMVRLLAMANKNMAEGRPLTAIKPAPQVLSKSQKMYGVAK